MSPLLRGILIIAVASIGSIALVLSDKNKIDYRYLRVLSIAFPFIDLHFYVGQLVVTTFLLISLVYIALKFKLFIWFVSRVPVLILICIMVITTIFSQFKLVSVLTVFQRLLLLTPIAAAYSCFLSREISKTLFSLILPPVIYTLVFAFIQLLIDPYFTLYYSLWGVEERLSLYYIDPQVAGCATATFIALLFNLYLESNKSTYLVLVAILFFVGCLTGSKTFLIGVTLAFAISILRSNFSTRNVFIVVFCILALSLTHNFWSELPVFHRMTEMHESFEGRSTVFWAGAWDIYLKNPIFGIGPGSFSSYVEYYHLPLKNDVDGKYVYASQPESGYLLWLDEYGIFSLGIIFLLFYVISRKGVASLNYCALIPWAVCFVSLYNVQYTHISVLLATIVGAIFAIHKIVSLYP